jgi:hypothetical protein
MWLKQCHVYHPPVITIFIGGMVTIAKWIVLTSLYYFPYDSVVLEFTLMIIDQRNYIRMC